MKLKELCSDERPREKMMDKGAAALSNAELIAILLRTGTGRMNVLELSQQLLRIAEGKLNNIMNMTCDSLCQINGIGPGKAITVAAAFELGRRSSLESIIDDKTSISNPRSVFRMMLPLLRGLDHEECWGIFLNRANYVIGKECFSKGGLDSTVLDIKSIVRKSLERKACGIIIVHNHPSGSRHPGEHDKAQTKRLLAAASSCDIELIDHIIIAGNNYFSFLDEGLI
jgi:DNA repair protein RadC